MTSKRRYIKHLFGGGWATDYGQSADVGPDSGGTLVFPFLTEAENVFFDLDGSPHKIGGNTKLNSVVVNSGNEIRGLFDFWRMGTAGSSSQRRVIYSGTAIYADNADGTFVSIKTGLEDDKVPCFTVFNDSLIMSSDSTVDVPMTWDGTTFANLGGTPPQFSFSCVHKNHVFAAGVAANPSLLYYSRTLNAGDWTHATSGSISIDPDDGDRITAIASYKDELWVFKGPYKGSIHRITGSANSGSDTWARKQFISGLGAVGHNTVFRFKDDLGFMWSDGTIHSLAATAAYGDFNESALSRPIHKYIRENFNFTYLTRAWAATHVNKSQVIFTIPTGSNTFCTQTLCMDYSRPQVWWSYWPALNANCVARVTDASQSNLAVLMIGGKDGFVRKTDVSTRAIDTSVPITAKATTPYTNYGLGYNMKTLAVASLAVTPAGNYAIYLRWTRAGFAQQSTSFSLAGGDVLGTSTGAQFTLNTSTLSGDVSFERFAELEEGGEFRAIQYQIYNAGLNEDMAARHIGAVIEIGAESSEP